MLRENDSSPQEDYKTPQNARRRPQNSSKITAKHLKKTAEHHRIPASKRSQNRCGCSSLLVFFKCSVVFLSCFMVFSNGLHCSGTPDLIVPKIVLLNYSILWWKLCFLEQASKEWSSFSLIMSALDFSFPLRQTRLLSTFSTKQNHLGITSHLGQLSLSSFRGQ